MFFKFVTTFRYLQPHLIYMIKKSYHGTANVGHAKNVKDGCVSGVRAAEIVYCPIQKHTAETLMIVTCMYAYMHIYTDTDLCMLHTHIHAHTHTCIHTHMHSCMHTHTHTHTHAHTHTHPPPSPPQPHTHREYSPVTAN